MEAELTELQYHEWCVATYPLGTHLYVRFEDPQDGVLELVGEVTGHPFEWEETGSAESGPSFTLVDIGVKVTADGLSLSVCPTGPNDDGDPVPADDPVIEVTDAPVGWMEGRERYEEEDRAMREREEDEHLERQTGYRVCPRCGERTVKVTHFYAPQYGDAPGTLNSTAEQCENAACGYKDVFV